MENEELQTYEVHETIEEPAKPKKAPKPKKEKKPGTGLSKKVVMTLVLGVLFGLCAGFTFYGVSKLTGAFEAAASLYESDVEKTKQVLTDAVPAPITTAEANPATATNVSYGSTDVSEVVERLMPAMVSIVNRGTEVTNFFGYEYSRDTAASASGIIIAEKDNELIIVTNNHVAANANTLEINFIDGTKANASVKGLDKELDVAVIAVKSSDLSNDTRKAISIASLGESTDLKLGKPVIVIGNALGYGQSVTTGIISALDREVKQSDGTIETYIMTNAAINPGNSGGALLNTDGEVIGIVNSKSGGGIIEGMGYAIPISKASPVIAEFMERRTKDQAVEEEKRGYLGVTLQTVSDDAIAYYGMPAGAFVYEIEENGGAKKAGMEKKDVITKFENVTITTVSDLLDELQYYKAGEEVELVAMRMENGEYIEKTFKVTLQEKAN